MSALHARAAAAALLAAAALGLGACGEDEGDSASSATESVPTETVPAVTETATTETATETAPAPTGAKLDISKDLKTKPEIPKPSGDPPTELVIQDVVKGTGKAAKTGDNVSVQYVGVLFSDGQQFDASWDRGKEPFAFELGAQMVIPGWDQGVVGMKKGGRRVLVIPPDLAYGPQGQGSIGPNATLVFVIDMEKVG